MATKPKKIATPKVESEPVTASEAAKVEISNVSISMPQSQVSAMAVEAVMAIAKAAEANGIALQSAAKALEGPPSYGIMINGVK